jgi:two-component system sensor histidine kinase ChvG
MALDGHRWQSHPDVSAVLARVNLARARAGRAVRPLVQTAAAAIEQATRLNRRVGAHVENVRHAVWAHIGPWCMRQPLWRFCTRSLGHRIFTANLVGFLILFVGLMLVSQSNRGLVDARLDGLETQARMAAVAIASTLRNDQMLVDAPGGEDPPQESSLATMALTIAPERVAPVVSRLIGGSGARVRVYGPDGFLIYDTTQRITRGQLTQPRPAPSAADNEPPPLQNAWTRFWSWLVSSHLRVYRDLMGAQGTLYAEVAEALSGKPARMLLLTKRGEQIVAVAAPVTSGGAVIGAALVSSRPGEIDDAIARQRQAILSILLLALAATLFASWMLTRTIAGPMQRLAAAAGHVKQSINARQELPEFAGRRDEVAEMAAAFRDMTEALYRRIEASDRFAQDVAHELKNPVAAARSTAESLAYSKSDEQRAELVRQIQGEMKRLNRLITDVAKASRLDAELALQETEPLDLSAVVTTVSAVMADVHSEAGVSVVFEAAPAGAPASRPFLVRAHEGRIAQVVTNLIDNAVSFSPVGGEIRVRVSREGPVVVMTVDDQGPGIPGDKLDDVFKRFYSDRPQSDRTRGKNSGLGLSISREIVLAHGGTLHAQNIPVSDSAPGPRCRDELEERRAPGCAGARFVMALPALSPA